MAEYILREAFENAGLADRVQVVSGGTTSWEQGERIDPRAGARLRDAGLDASAHRARQVEPDELAHADLILALDHDHLSALRRMGGPDIRGRLHLLREFDPDASGDLGIRDPWYGDASDFASTERMIRAAADGIVDHVAQQLEAREERAAVDEA